MRRITRLGGALAAIGLTAGLTLAVPGSALATAGCPAWDGTQPPVPGARSEFLAVTVAGPCDVWMAGYAGTGQGGRFPLMEHWTGGPSWTAMPSPGPGIDAEWQGVSAVSPADVWAVGFSVDSAGHSSVLAQHWDGTSWAQKPVPGPASKELPGVVSISPTSALAVGDAGAGVPLVLRWDGHNWTQTPTLSLGAVGHLDAVAAGPAGAWAAGFRAPSPASPDQAGAIVLATVPSVVGQSQAAAADTLNSAGLTSTVTHVTTATGGCSLTALGTVIATSPAPGTFTAPPVNLSVCDIPPSLTVPTVTGLADNQAQGTITDAGLTVGTITLSGNCSFPPGTVIRQSPTAGITASRGSAVNLTEATPPKPHGCAQ